MNNKTIAFVIYAILGLTFTLPCHAVKMKLLKKQPKAFFTEDSNGLFKGLSLNTKVYIFNSKDGLYCGSSLKRGLDSLSYYCQVDLPDAENITKIHKVETHNKVSVVYGRLKKTVYINVDPNGQFVKFSIDFDETGIDWDISKFNDEFYAVYAKSAQTILAKAMLKKGLKIQTVDKK